MLVRNDEKLLELIKSGSREAFDELVLKYHREIYFLTLRMSKKNEDAEELTQQIFIKAFEKLDTFRGESGFKTWLYQVAINQCRSFFRSKKDTCELTEAADNISAHEENPSEKALKNEASSAALEAVSDLPEKQKSAVILRIYHEMSYEEIGKIIGCSEQTAKVNFHYGIENLRKKLKSNGIM